MEDITKRGHNVRASLEQKIRLYSSGNAKGLIHGFQKDSIQNGWGHRINKNGQDWKLRFELVDNSKGSFIVVEDIGCTGLIGHNYTQQEIEKLMEIPDSLPENEKLARFSTLNNSGGNTNSAGTNGIGKQMYQAVSKIFKYYFDSYTNECKYYSNYVDTYENTFVKALEEDEAKQFIMDETSLEPKETFGTRIIIVDPIDELVASMKSGDFIKYINETWWRIILKYNATIEVVDNGEVLYTSDVPLIYRESMNSVYYQEYAPVPYDANYQIKKMGICYVPDCEIEDDLSNISYYRKGMKIGNIFSENSIILDEKYTKKIWGFVEFEDGSDWELDLSDKEDLVHYGPSRTNVPPFAKLRDLVVKKVNEYGLSKGLVKTKEYKDVDKELNDLANTLTDYLKQKDFKLPWESSVRKKGSKPINIECIKKYPNAPDRSIELGQNVFFYYKVSNSTVHSEFNVEISISNEKESRIISRKTINFTNTYKSEEFCINFDDFYNNSRNLISISIISKERNDIKDKCTFPVFVNINDESNEEDFELQLYYQMPREDSLSIYSNESITDMSVDIVNNSEHDCVFSLRVISQDVEDNKSQIAEEFLIKDIEVNNNSVKNVELGSIIFGEKYYNRKGLLRIKFILIHENGLTDFDRGDKLLQKYFSLLFNTEQIDNSIKPPFNVTQSLLENKNIKYKFTGDALIFNTAYSMWKEVSKDPNSFLYKMYTLTIIFRVILNMQFANGDFTTIGKTYEEFYDTPSLEVEELIEKAMDEYLGDLFEVIPYAKN